MLNLCSIRELKGALSENRRILYRQNGVQLNAFKDLAQNLADRRPEVRSWS